MRYFLSLGMNKPPQMASSVPVMSQNIPTPILNKVVASRPRTKTSPSKMKMLSSEQIEEEEENSHRKRAISTPIPIGIQTNSIPIPHGSNTNGRTSPNSFEEEGRDDDSFEEEKVDEAEEEELEFEMDSGKLLSTSLNGASPKQFIPPHEMLKQMNSADFNVGTAQSLAVWQNRRRQYI